MITLTLAIMAMSIMRSIASLIMANYPSAIWTICKRARALMSKMTSAIRLTLSYGKRQNLVSHNGHRHGVKDVRAGILSVQRCRPNALAILLIFMAVVMIYSFHIMKMR